MSEKHFINLLFPDGRAFSSVGDQDKYNEVLGLFVKRIIDELEIFQSQLWYVDDDFDPEPWEERYNISIAPFATIEERRMIVKSYMTFPDSTNRMSIDYLQSQLESQGFTDVVIETNETGSLVGKLHGNNVTDTEAYNIGSEAYNSIRITGTIKSNYYDKMLLLLMSIKPLDTVVFDEIQFKQALAINESLTLAIDSSTTLAITEI